MGKDEKIDGPCMSYEYVNVDSLFKIATFLEGVKMSGNRLPGLGFEALEDLYKAASLLNGDVRYRIKRHGEDYFLKPVFNEEAVSRLCNKIGEEIEKLEKYPACRMGIGETLLNIGRNTPSIGFKKGSWYQINDNQIIKFKHIKVIHSEEFGSHIVFFAEYLISSGDPGFTTDNSLVLSKKSWENLSIQEVTLGYPGSFNIKLEGLTHKGDQMFINRQEWVIDNEAWSGSGWKTVTETDKLITILEYDEFSNPTVALFTKQQNA